jgi:hypothetical protein
VLIMGPVMNLALAVVVMALVLYQGAPVPLYESQPVEVGTVIEGSVAEAAGLRPGDRDPPRQRHRRSELGEASDGDRAPGEPRGLAAHRACGAAPRSGA